MCYGEQNWGSPLEVGENLSALIQLRLAEAGSEFFMPLSTNEILVSNNSIALCQWRNNKHKVTKSEWFRSLLLPKTPKRCDLQIKNLHSTAKWIASVTPRDLLNAWTTKKPAIYRNTAFVIASLLREHSPVSVTAINIHLGLQIYDKADKGKISHHWSLICRSTTLKDDHQSPTEILCKTS